MHNPSDNQFVPGADRVRPFARVPDQADQFDTLEVAGTAFATDRGRHLERTTEGPGRGGDENVS